VHSVRKHSLAGIFDNNADIVSKIEKKWPFYAQKLIILDFLPISASFARFRDIDFPQ